MKKDSSKLLSKILKLKFGVQIQGVKLKIQKLQQSLDGIIKEI